MDSIELKSGLTDLKNRLVEIREGIFDVTAKEKRLKDIEADLSKEEVWSDLDLSQKISKEKTILEKSLKSFMSVEEKVSDGLVLLEIAEDESDDNSINEIIKEFSELEEAVSKLEFSKMFTNKMDPASAYVEIQSGSGGTEAQDWAEMLLRMYSKWAESRDFNIDITEISHGEIAGIKSATLHVSGDYSYGWLRTETGVHRLVRKSPFDSGSRRHTSFASVFISKHKNKENALKQLKSKLYELELQKQNQERQELEESKSDIGWGSQIRSYVLDQSRIKDLRTGHETGNTAAVLNGELDEFMKTSLKAGV